MTAPFGRGTRIAGTGRALPAEVLTNADLEKIVDTSDEWIVQRTGIRARHRAAEARINEKIVERLATVKLEQVEA